eukprot:9789674-Prorocentrum_lima.AAC.1
MVGPSAGGDDLWLHSCEIDGPERVEGPWCRGQALVKMIADPDINYDLAAGLPVGHVAPTSASDKQLVAE